MSYWQLLARLIFQLSLQKAGRQVQWSYVKTSARAQIWLDNYSE